MRWSDVDLTAKVWLIPAEHTKEKRIRRVHLPKQAAKLLSAMYAISYLGDDDVYVLPSMRGDRPMSENGLTVALAAMNFGKEQTAHGFRATASTFMHKELSINRDVIELCLGHRLVGKVAKAYLRDADDTYMSAERAAAMQKYADFLDALKDGRTAKPGNARARS
jgi:integrase